MRRASLVLLLALFLCQPSAPATAQAGGYVEPANLTALVAAAAKEGTLNLSAGQSYGGAPGARMIQEALDKRYHINLTINYSPVAGGVQFIQQMVQEMRANQTPTSDIIFATYGTQGALPFVAPIDYRKFVPDLPENAMFFGRKSVGLYVSLEAFDYNTKLIPANVAPKSFADLLKPQWKGKIASSAYQGSFLSYIGLPSVMGHQGMLDYVTKFSAQVGGLFPCAEIDRVVSGEFSIFGIDCGDYEVRKRQRKGEPIAAMYPREGTVMAYTDPSVPINAAHPNAARLFVAFLLTREGQDLLWDVAASDNDRLPGSHMAPIIAQLRRQGVKFVDGMASAQLSETATYAKEIGAIINQGR